MALLRRLWSDATPMVFLAMLHMVAYSATRPLVSLYAAETGGTAAVGIIFSTHNAVQFGFGVLAGIAVDRWRARNVAIVGSILFAASIAWTALLGGWMMLVLAQAFAGVAHILVQVAYQSHIAGLPNREHNVGLLTFGISAGQGIGPPLVGLVADSWGLTTALWVATGIGAIALTCALLVTNSAHGSVLPPQKGTSGIMRQPQLVRAIVVSTTVLFALDVLSTYFPVYGRELGLSVAAIGTVLAVRAFASMFVRPFMGFIVERFGRMRVLGMSILLGGIALALFAVAPSFWVLVPVAGLLGFTLGLAQPLTIVIVSTEAHEHQRGQAMAFRLMGNRLGQTLSPLVFGFIASIFGFASIFWLSGGLLALTYPLIRRKGAGSKHDVLGSSP